MLDLETIDMPLYIYRLWVNASWYSRRYGLGVRCNFSLDGVSPSRGHRDASQAPLVVSVKVERRKCGACGACAWASDNWRKTSVFNYNNYFLVELSLLYKCLGQFISGTTIQSFFVAHLEPLATNFGWLSENPDLAKRFDGMWDC